MSKEAMKLALGELQAGKVGIAMQILREALAEQPAQQEPVAGKGKELSERLKLCARNVAFAASGSVDMSSAAMQEMFALIDHVCVGIDSPPAQRKPLTEYEIEDLYFDKFSMGELKAFARAIEAAHGIKENA